MCKGFPKFKALSVNKHHCLLGKVKNMSVVPKNGSGTASKSNIIANPKRPPKESFCEFEIVEKYQRESKKKRNRSKSTDLLKRIEELTARNTEIEQLYKNLKMQKESCSNTNSQESSKLDTTDEIVGSNTKLRINSARNRKNKNIRSDKTCNKNNKSDVKVKKLPSKIAEIKEILEKELSEHKHKIKDKVENNSCIQIKSLICQNCSGLIDEIQNNNNTHSPNINKVSICQNCSGEINKNAAIYQAKNKRRLHKKPPKKDTAGIRTSVQENVQHTTCKDNTIITVYSNKNPIDETESGLPKYLKEIKINAPKTNPGNNGEPEKSKNQKKRTYPSILKQPIPDLPCPVGKINVKCNENKNIQVKLINLPLGDRINYNREKEENLKSQLRTCLKLDKEKPKHFKVNRKELSFSNLNLLPMEGLYLNFEQPVTQATQTSQYKMLEKNRTRSRSELPLKRNLVPIIQRNKSCDNRSPNSNDRKCKRQQMLPCKALKEISKVFELEKAAENYKNKSYTSRSLDANPVEKKYDYAMDPNHRKEMKHIFDNCKFHSSKIIPSERTIEVASKVLRNQKISFTVEGIEPPKKLAIVRKNEKINKNKINLRTQLFPGIDLRLNQINLLNHGSHRRELTSNKSTYMSNDSFSNTTKVFISDSNNSKVPIKVEVAEECNNLGKHSSSSYVSSKPTSKRKKIHFIRKKKGPFRSHPITPRKYSEDPTLKSKHTFSTRIESSTQTINFNHQEGPSSCFENELFNQNSVLLGRLNYENISIEKKDVAVEANLLVSDFKLSQSFECSCCSPSHIILSNMEENECKFMSYLLNKLHFDGKRLSENSSKKSSRNNFIVFNQQVNTSFKQENSEQTKNSVCVINSESRSKINGRSNNELVKTDIILTTVDDNTSILENQDFPNDVPFKSKGAEKIDERKSTEKCQKVEEFDDKNPFKSDDDTPVPNIKKYAQKEIMELEGYLSEILQKISSKNYDEINSINEFIQPKVEPSKCDTLSAFSSTTNELKIEVSKKQKLRKNANYSNNIEKLRFKKSDVKSVYKNTTEYYSSTSFDSSNELLDASKSSSSVICKKSISQRFTKALQAQKKQKLRDIYRNRVYKRKSKSRLKSKLVKLKNLSKNSFKEESFSNIVVLSVSSTNNFKTRSYLRKFCNKLIYESAVSLGESETPAMLEDKRIISKEPFYINSKTSIKKSNVQPGKSSADSLEEKPIVCPLTSVFNSSKPNYTYFVYNTEVITTGMKKTKCNEDDSTIKTKPAKTLNLGMSSFASTSQDNNSVIFNEIKKPKRSPSPQKNTKNNNPNFDAIMKTKADASPIIARKKLLDHKMMEETESFCNNVSTFSDTTSSICKNFIVKYVTKSEKAQNGTTPKAKPSIVKMNTSKSKSVLNFKSSKSHSNESGYDTCKTSSKSNFMKTFFKRKSIMDLFKPVSRKNSIKNKDPSISSINLDAMEDSRPVDSETSINVFNVKSSRTVLWLNFSRKKSKRDEKTKVAKKTSYRQNSKNKTQSTNTPKVDKCTCLADYEARSEECKKYADKVLLESALRKEGYVKEYNDFKEIPLDVLMGKRMIKSLKPRRYSDKVLAKPMPTQTSFHEEPKLEEPILEELKLEEPKLKEPKVLKRDVSFSVSDIKIEPKTSSELSSKSSLLGFSESSDEEEIKTHDDFIKENELEEDSVTTIMDKRVSSVTVMKKRKLTDKEVFDKLLVKYENGNSIAEQLSRDEEFFQEQLSLVSSSKSFDKSGKKKKDSFVEKFNLKDKEDTKIRGPRFHDKPYPGTKENCEVQADDIGTCFARGFRPDNLLLSGEACFNLNKQDKIKMSPQVLKNTESIIDFSERETPLDFLLALGFMVDEASNALKDDDIRSRLLAAITEARVWINKITTTQGTLLYLVAYKSRPDTMRYFLQLVEAIINKRITNAVKLDGFLRILEQVEDGRIQMINILGDDKFEDEENEELLVKKQMRNLFVNVYTIAENEAGLQNRNLSNFQVDLLRILVAKYRAGLHPHLELIARYIGQGLLVSEVQLEAAMIFLSRLDTADVKLKEFENYCGINCDRS